jgi:hypothetical protein
MGPRFRGGDVVPATLFVVPATLFVVPATLFVVPAKAGTHVV